MPTSEPQGCLFSIFKLIGISFGSNKTQTRLPYRRKNYLLSKAERSFFEVLKQSTKEKYQIFAMVRLADLLYIPKGTESRQSYFNKIQSKHIDFVLCDSKSIQPVLAIELDDSSHDRSDRRERDAFVDEALQSAGLALLRVRVSHGYDIRNLTLQIDEKII